MWHLYIIASMLAAGVVIKLMLALAGKGRHRHGGAVTAADRKLGLALAAVIPIATLCLYLPLGRPDLPGSPAIFNNPGEMWSRQQALLRTRARRPDLFSRIVPDREAEKLLRSMQRTSSCCLTVCDKNGGCVFEITPANLEVRSAVNGVTCCTNHFRTDTLTTTTKCWRYDALAPLQAKDAAKVDVADVFKQLDAVHQGKATLQSMVFEPAERVLHFAYGEGPATRRDVRRLDLGKLFD